MNLCREEDFIIFIIDKILYYYKFMFFGLKNVEGIYYRLVNKIFKEEIDDKEECYVDDMIIKSKKSSDYVADFVYFFDKFYVYRM